MEITLPSGSGEFSRAWSDKAFDSWMPKGWRRREWSEEASEDFGNRALFVSEAAAVRLEDGFGIGLGGIFDRTYDHTLRKWGHRGTICGLRVFFHKDVPDGQVRLVWNWRMLKDLPDGCLAIEDECKV